MEDRMEDIDRMEEAVGFALPETRRLRWDQAVKQADELSRSGRHREARDLMADHFDYDDLEDPTMDNARWQIRRADGEMIDGDLLTWHDAGDGDEPEWDQVDGYDHEEPTEYIAERVQVVEIRTRVLSDLPSVDA